MVEKFSDVKADSEESDISEESNTLVGIDGETEFEESVAIETGVEVGTETEVAVSLTKLALAYSVS